MKLLPFQAVAAVASVLLIAGCSASAEPPANPPGNTTAPAGESSSETPASDDVAVLKVTTTGKATVTWGSTGGTSQDEITKNWTEEVKLNESFDAVTLSVVSTDFNKSVTVTCEILIGGESKVKNQGKGKVASANCTTTA